MCRLVEMRLRPDHYQQQNKVVESAVSLLTVNGDDHILNTALH